MVSEKIHSQREKGEKLHAIQRKVGDPVDGGGVGIADMQTESEPQISLDPSTEYGAMHVSLPIGNQRGEQSDQTVVDKGAVTAVMKNIQGVLGTDTSKGEKVPSCTELVNKKDFAVTGTDSRPSGNGNVGMGTYKKLKGRSRRSGEEQVVTNAIGMKRNMDGEDMEWETEAKKQKKSELDADQSTNFSDAGLNEQPCVKI